MNTILEALRELKLENLDFNEYYTTKINQIESDKYIVHFTHTADQLNLILDSRKINLGKNNTISFTSGFDSNNSRLPLQYLRGDNSAWKFGIQFPKNQFNLIPYSDARNKLKVEQVKSNLLKISDLLLLDNDDCWICVTARELPIAISKDFYNYLYEVLTYQSENFLITHLNKSLKPPHNFSKIENCYKEKIKIKDGLQFRTKKSNHGVYITCNPNFTLVGKVRERGFSTINRHKMSAETYIDEVRKLKSEIHEKEELIKIKNDELTKTKNELEKAQDKYNNFDKSRGQIAYDRIKTNITNLNKEITNLENDIKKIESDCDENLKHLNSLLYSFESNRDGVNRDGVSSSVGGAVIYIPKEFGEQLINSVSLDEKELISKEELNFDYNAVDAIYIPKFYKITPDYIINLLDYCSSYEHDTSTEMHDYIVTKRNKKLENNEDDILKFNNNDKALKFKISLNNILNIIKMNKILLIVYDPNNKADIRYIK